MASAGLTTRITDIDEIIRLYAKDSRRLAARLANWRKTAHA